jgi:hypothetical protein
VLARDVEEDATKAVAAGIVKMILARNFILML